MDHICTISHKEAGITFIVYRRTMKDSFYVLRTLNHGAKTDPDKVFPRLLTLKNHIASEVQEMKG